MVDPNSMNNMDQLIPVINRLQDVFHSVGFMETIDLPQIVVVGAQSSGKSSVLENIVGRDFLPRGTGIVTRRPLVLQLISTPKKPKTPADQEEWGEFLHVQNKRFYNFKDIREEIERETDRLCGKSGSISPQPIHLRVYSPNVVNLTLVDLPGIVKVALPSQPKDIPQQIRQMILQFVTKPNSIILAITAANTDVANSDALKLAKEVDPNGERTLGVLTKIDIMDSGTNCMDVLSGRVIPLRRGYIGVVNRNHQDTISGKAIRKAVEDESKFFQSHPSYRGIANKMGTLYLSKTLNLILLNHIRETLPAIRQKISALIQQAQQVLAVYGSGPNIDSKAGQGGLFLQLITEFTNNYIEAIDGRSASLSTQELFGGARINFLFVDKYAPYIQRMDACEGLTEKDIRMAIRIAKGARSSLFVPESSFEMLVRKQVQLLEEPSIRCIDQVYDELLRIIEHSEKPLERFPKLRDSVVEFVVNLLRRYRDPTRDFVTDLIRTEMAYINTSHPDFFGGGHTLQLLVEKLQQSRLGSSSQQQQQQQQQGQGGFRQPPPPPSSQFSQGGSGGLTPESREAVEMDVIRTLLTSYFNIVRKNIADLIPKAIMHFLVNKSKHNMQSELVAFLYKEELFDDLLKENEEVAAKRKAAQEMLKVLRKAQDVLTDVKDMQL